MNRAYANRDVQGERFATDPFQFLQRGKSSALYKACNQRSVTLLLLVNAVNFSLAVVGELARVSACVNGPLSHSSSPERGRCPLYCPPKVWDKLSALQDISAKKKLTATEFNAVGSSRAATIKGALFTVLSQALLDIVCCPIWLWGMPSLLFLCVSYT